MSILLAGFCAVLIPVAGSPFRPLTTHSGTIGPGEEVVNVRTAYGADAGSIVPVHDDSVRLVSQYVNVVLPSDTSVRGQFACEYRIENLSGAARDVRMAYVVNPAWLGGRRDVYERYHFVVESQPGRAIPFELVNFVPGELAGLGAELGDQPASLPVWSVHLAAHGESSIFVRHDATWTSVTGGEHYLYAFMFHGALSAAWAGRVDETAVTFQIGNVVAALLAGAGGVRPLPNLFIKPGDGHWEEGTVTWHRNNWEPSEDFIVSIERVAARDPLSSGTVKPK